MNIKRIRILIAVLILALIPSFLVINAHAQKQAGTDAGICYVPGDVNQDGSVTSRDAIYTLYASIPELNYTVQQDCDFDHSGTVDRDDAIWLLYAALGMGNHKLGDNVHSGQAIVWEWSDDYTSATATIYCAQGHTVAEPVSAEITTEHQDASCTAAGYDTYRAVVSIDGQEYTDIKTISIPVAEHVIGTPDCTKDVTCANCSYTLPATGHDFSEKIEEASTAATCTAPAKEVWQCACGEQKTVSVGNPLPHNLSSVKTTAPVEGSSCKYIDSVIYSCSECSYTYSVDTDAYESHVYVGTTTAEPTCSQTGTISYSCSVEGCDSAKEDVIPVNPNAHTWDAGTTAEGVTTYTCSGCGETKTSVAQGEGVAAASLSGSTEITLENNAAVMLDVATIHGLQSDDEEAEGLIQITVTDVTSAVDASILPQKDNYTVYDLQMTLDGTTVSSFDGSVTVSLPYTLQPGDDVSAIDVYFINDSNQLECMQGTYFNGYVTFTTGHFSYYAIFDMTPWQICEWFGHQALETSAMKEPTCEEDGYVITTCLSCGYSEFYADETMAAKGHRFDEQIPSGHCTEDIIFERKCYDCDFSDFMVIPAIGHNLEENDDGSVAPTCTTPGKIVYTCNNIVSIIDDPVLTEVCGHTAEEFVPALGHSYEGTELTPSCTVGGGTQYTCVNCADTYTEYTSAAPGHDYSTAGWEWDWNDTRTIPNAVSLLLTCSNCDSVHQQNAVISKKAVSASCEAGGTITYTAAASHNLQTYTDTATVTNGSATGHTRGETFLHNADQHYKECTVCGATIDAGEHAWNSGTVTKEATCTKSGTLLQSCLVCNREKTSSIPASGHSYDENGICTICGEEQVDCDHIRMTRTELDLSAYNICEGTQLTLESCECGQQSQLIWTSRCNFEYRESEYIIDQETGFGHYLYINHCVDCDLTLEMTEFGVEFDSTTCTGWNYITTKASVGDTVIADTKFVEMSSEFQHPTLPTGNADDLSEYGLCGVIVEEMACPCGKHVSKGVTSSQCDFRYDNEQSTNDTRVFECQKCGAVETVTHSNFQDKDSCNMVYTNCVTYYMDGEQIYGYETSESYQSHSYQVVSYELNNEKTCEDGIYISYQCSVCGKERDLFAFGHMNIHSVQTDLTDADICHDYAIQSSCPCEIGYASSYLTGDMACRWQHKDYTYDDATGTETWNNVCSVCQATWSRTRIPGEKAEDCLVRNRYENKYYDKDGTLLFTGNEAQMEERHNLSTQYTLTGTSCEDGVTVTEACADCDYSYTYTTTDHEISLKASYDVSDLGMCAPTLQVYTCPCGYASHLEGYYNCNWDWIEGSPSSTTRRCANCGTFVIDSTSYGDAIDSCQTKTTETYTFQKEGVESVTISLDGVESHHAWVYEMTLLEGGTTCMDGYSFHRECLVCGMEQSGTSNPGDHYTQPVARELLTANLSEEDKLCAELDLVTESCACGAETSTQIHWRGVNTCNFYENDLGYRDEALDTWVYTCSKCGVQHYTLDSQAVLSKDNPCKRVYADTEVYLRNNKELFQAETSSYYYNHTETCTFEPLGETCDDGYRVLCECQLCGETWFDRVAYGCDEMFRTDAEILTHEGICGVISLNTWSCYCGANQTVDISEDACSFDYLSYDDASQSEVSQCSKCGLIRYIHNGESTQVDNCHWQYPRTFTYYLGEECLGSLEYMEQYSSHTNVHSFRLQGESCEDGYYVDGKCIYCGESYTGDELYYEHDIRLMEYIDPAKDLGTCDGYLDRRACACGETDYWKGVFCEDTQPTGEIDEETGLPYYFCDKCNTTILWGTINSEAENCHTTFTYRLKLIRDGEVILDMTKPCSSTTHDYIGTGATFLTPSENCNDGVVITFTCQYCDDTYTKEVWYHYNYIQFSMDFRKYFGSDTCKGYIDRFGCACGQEQYVSQNYWYCSWASVPGESYSATIDGVEHFYESYVCQNCGLIRDVDRYLEKVEGSCTAYEYQTVTFSKGDAEPFCFSSVNMLDNHTYVYDSWSAVNGNCDNGYTVIRTCTTCNMTDTQEGEGHWDFITESADLGALGYCPGTVGNATCACGLFTNFIHQTSCSWSYIHAESSGDGVDYRYYDKYQCSECKLIWESRQWYEATDDPCILTRYESNTYSTPAGEEIITITHHQDWENHTYTYQYTLRGESCKEGVDLAGVCVCGATDSQYIDYHNANLNQRTVSMPNGACAGTITYGQCPCGEEMFVDESNFHCDYSDGSHAYTHYTDNEGRIHTLDSWTCGECELEHVTDWFNSNEGCFFNRCYTHTYILGEHKVVFEVEEPVTNHTPQNTYTLKEGSETCEDGILCTQTCKYCDYSDSWTEYSHCKNVTVYELPEGSCGGTVTLYACPCETASYVERDYLCSFDAYLGGESDGHSSGWSQYSCETCGTIELNEWTDESLGNCRYDRTNTYIYSHEGERDVIVRALCYNSESHGYEYTYTLAEGSTTCEDGVLISYTCECGEYSGTGSTDSHEVNEEILWMPADACGDGYVQYYYCACKERSGLNRYTKCAFELTDEECINNDNGTSYVRYTNTCSACGLQYVLKKYTRTTDGCKITCPYSCTYYWNGEQIGEFYYREYEYTHEYVNTAAVLLDGASTCEDGVQVTEVCSLCGDTSTRIAYDHVCAVAFYVDFSKYNDCTNRGVTQLLCPCGAEAGLDWDGGRSFTSIGGGSVENIDGVDHYRYHNRCNYCDIYYWYEKYSVPNGDGTHTLYQEYDLYYQPPAQNMVELGTVYSKSIS